MPGLVSVVGENTNNGEEDDFSLEVLVVVASGSSGHNCTILR